MLFVKSILSIISRRVAYLWCTCSTEAMIGSFSRTAYSRLQLRLRIPGTCAQVIVIGRLITFTRYSWRAEVFWWTQIIVLKMRFFEIAKCGKKGLRRNLSKMNYINKRFQFMKIEKDLTREKKNRAYLKSRLNVQFE